MSFDHLDDIELIESFIGKVCERTLACNSLKLRFGVKRPYIWIDPPWILKLHSTVVVDSNQYYELVDQFEFWSEKLTPLNQITFSSYQYERGTLNLNFVNGYSLVVPASIAEVTDNDFYHHWYASA